MAQLARAGLKADTWLAPLEEQRIRIFQANRVVDGDDVE